jgi:hypothetical protein
VPVVPTRHFITFGSLSTSSSYYWLGIELSGYQFYGVDGSGSLGTGLPSNSNPYAHWWLDILDDFNTNRATQEGCILAHYAYMYSEYRCEAGAIRWHH